MVRLTNSTVSSNQLTIKSTFCTHTKLGSERKVEERYPDKEALLNGLIWVIKMTAVAKASKLFIGSTWLQKNIEQCCIWIVLNAKK